MQVPNRDDYIDLIEKARQEDLGGGDVTSEAMIPAGMVGRGALVFREAGVLAGMGIVWPLPFLSDGLLWHGSDRLPTGRLRSIRPTD